MVWFRWVILVTIIGFLAKKFADGVGGKSVGSSAGGMKLGWRDVLFQV